MRSSRQFGVRLSLALLAALVAVILIASPTVSDRMNSTVLILFGAAAIIVLVPWDKLASLKAVGVELTLNLPHVREAVDSLDRIAQATGGNPVDNRRVLRSLERLDSELEAAAGSRVVWIDDNPLQIIGVRRLLRALGVEIVLATSTRRAEELLQQDNDFDLLISDLMRNSPEECITFEWMCEQVGARDVGEPEIIERDDGSEVAFEVRHAAGGLAVHQRREGVHFIVQLRTESGRDPVVQNLPVLFYASFSSQEATAYAKPAELDGFDTHVATSAESLIPAAIKMLAASRATPIAVGGAKKLVKR
jgi:CheY-like chemotaxis protein